MNVKYEFADQHDIEKITDLRMQYLLEAYGGIKQDELRIIRENNLRYLKKYLNEKQIGSSRLSFAKSEYMNQSM